MARKRIKKSRRKRIGVPRRVKLLGVALTVLVVAGIATVKFLQGPRGKVALVDAGFTGYYAEVQGTVDGALRPVLGELGFGERLKETVRPLVANGDRFLYRDWRIPYAPPRDLVPVNLAMAKAVHAAGGVVRSSIEVPPRAGASAPSLVLHVGSHRYTTHVITFHPEGEPAGGAYPARAAPASRRPRIAIVIDDFGYHRNDLTESFFEFDAPITCSVIPALRHSRYAVSRAFTEGKLVMLHIPMEAIDTEASRQSGDVVLTSMESHSIDALIERMINAYPRAAGVNNHQGSRATEDERVMRAVIGVLREHGRFFLDSLTSSRSIAYNTAKSLGVPAARNDVFLDADTEDPEVVAERLWRLVSIARERGYAIGIGHPKPWTLAALEENAGSIRDSGVDFVFVAELLQ